MQLIRSTLDGVGTGAGVAWPLFGILTSSLGIAAGSTVALATGSIASVLFCGICCGIFLISYQNALKQNTAASEKINKYIKRLNIEVNQLLEDSYQGYLAHCKLESKEVNAHDALSYINSRLNSKIRAAKKFPTKFQSPNTLKILEELLKSGQPKKSNELLSAFIMQKMEHNNNQEFIALYIQSLIHRVVLEIPLSPLPFSSSFKTGFVAFAGAFGSIAGCSAGFMGLLSGLGVISGFSALPVLGLSILGIATVLAIVVAVEAVRNATELHKLNSLKSSIKLVCNDLKDIHNEFDIQSRAESIAANTMNAPHHPPVFRHRFSNSSDDSDDEDVEHRQVQTM
ncbi:hypothetical protein [Legionella yabuuchiae]|uniref:hypothetical protein n=1 Tax=Legionella yabuuchiae TaxID=376727 RepID=UPI001056A7F0|nr:hypothetical protein [Legionella yabuuchiae]